MYAEMTSLNDFIIYLHLKRGNLFFGCHEDLGLWLPVLPLEICEIVANVANLI